MNASELFVKCLEQEGVEYIFGVPGEENLAFLEALRTSKIKMIVTRHEQAAAFMAATYGRLTGRTGVALSTLGPGATNFVTAVAYAQLGGMPLLIITGQKPIKKSKQGRFQIIDVVQMMKPITKMAERIVSSDRIPSLVREAFKIAEDERPGAVHLELPEDIADETVEDLSPLERIKVRRPGPDPKAITEAVAMIEKAKHPLLVIAAGANRKLISRRLSEFVEKTGIPFVTTQMGKGVVDERNDLYMGTTALTADDYVHCIVEKADLIITVGHDVYEKPPALLGQGKKKVLHIHFYPAAIDDVYFPNYEVVGDIAHTMWALSEAVTPQSHWDFSTFIKNKSQGEKFIHTKDDVSSFPIIPQRFVADLRKVIPEDGIIALDNGVYKLWVARNYPAIGQNTVLLDNALATMGAGLPSAMGAKMIYPEKVVVAICGDGGFMMNSQEIETAVRLKLDLVVIILNDNGYGMIKWKQKGMGLPDFALDYGNPDFVKYAESYGAYGHRLDKTENFEKLLSDCIRSKGVHIIEVPVDYSENHTVFYEELKSKQCEV
ncbi:MAG: acetolactate synthase large subunit [Candidatus Gracilibacteria bacterium]